MQYFALAIQGYIRKLDEFIRSKTKIELTKEENQVRVVAQRSAKNISVIIKDFLKVPPWPRVSTSHITFLQTIHILVNLV